MIPPADDEDELNGPDSAAAEGDASGEGKKGKSGGAAGGAKFSVNEDEDAARRSKGDSGEGDSDSFGRGKAGAGAGGGIKVSAQKLKQIMADWRHLDLNEVLEAVAEFFSEMPMRASANLSVTWEKNKANAKSFAIVNWVIEFGESMVRELARTRERTRGAGRDTRGLQQQKPRNPASKLGMAAGPTGPTAR